MSSIDKIIKTLCSEVRLKLVLCIGEKEKTVNELISNCGLSQSAVSQHLLKLKEAGIVSDNKKGREVFYSLKNQKFAKVSKELLNLERENL